MSDFDVERANFLLKTFCNSRHCGDCGVEFVFNTLFTSECSYANFVTSYPEGSNLVNIFNCVDCGVEEYRCDECSTVDEDLCIKCYEEQEKEDDPEEAKCFVCEKSMEKPIWCDGCGEGVHNHCSIEYTEDLVICLACDKKSL
jgi:hypothetical protein